jgi:hypothetical protein
MCTVHGGGCRQVRARVRLGQGLPVSDEVNAITTMVMYQVRVSVIGRNRARVRVRL